MDLGLLIKKYKGEAEKNPKDYLSLFYLGLLYCEQKDYHLACSSLQKAAALNPSYYRAFYFSGIAYACASKADLASLEWEMFIKHNPKPFEKHEPVEYPFDFDEAACLKKALNECIQRRKLLPNDAHTAYSLALAYIIAHQISMATREMEEVLKLDPSFLKAYFLLVELYLKLKEAGKAIEVLKKLIRQEPGSHVAHYKLGQLLIQQNDVSTALPILQKALQLKPNNDIIHLEMGKAYRLQGKDELARTTFKKVLEMNPKSADAHYELGLLAEGKYDFTTAVQHYQKSIQLNENKGEAYSSLGQIYKRQGKMHMAIENLEKSVIFLPEDSFLHSQLGEAYRAIKQDKDAVKEFREALRYNQKDVFSYLNLGISLSRLNEFDEALSAFKKALEIKPDFIDPYYNIAMTYLRMGHLTFARECIEKFLKVKPNDTYAHFALGNIHLRFGDLDNAISQYKIAIDSYPNHPYARFNLASSYAQAGQYDLAEAEFSKALELNPPDTEDEMILFATLASYHTILQNLAKAMSEIQKAFQLYEDAKTRYQSEEKIKNRIAELFKKVLPETVAEDLMSKEKEVADEQREVTVVFSDIRGYTTLTEMIGGREAMKILNDYYSYMSKISNKYGGSLLYFQGDAQMIIFGAPQEDPEHPIHALKAAMEMKRTVGLLSEKWFRGSNVQFEIAVGITTGEVVMGFINDGTRLQYTAIGDTVNVAARLQDVSKEHNSAVMLNEKSYERVKDYVKAQRLDSIYLKGRKESLNVFKIEKFFDPDQPSFGDFIKGALDEYEKKGG